MECFGTNKTAPVLLSPTIWKSEYENKCNSLSKIHHEDKKNNLALILGVVGGVLIAVLIEEKDLLNGQSAAEFVHDAKAYDDNVHDPSTNCKNDVDNNEYNNLDVDELDGSSLVEYRNINPDFEYSCVDTTTNPVPEPNEYELDGSSFIGYRNTDAYLNMNPTTNPVPNPNEYAAYIDTEPNEYASPLS
eukprot:Pgem_evm2s6460